MCWRKVNYSVHEGLKNFQCEHCGKAFGGPSALKVHVDAVHVGKKVSCDRCDKLFTQAKSLKIHKITVHDGIRKYVCSQCGKAFTQSGDLKRHKSTHTRNKEFQNF